MYTLYKLLKQCSMTNPYKQPSFKYTMCKFWLLQYNSKQPKHLQKDSGNSLTREIYTKTTKYLNKYNLFKNMYKVKSKDQFNLKVLVHFTTNFEAIMSLIFQTGTFKSW